jgi:hypothetical protein
VDRNVRSIIDEEIVAHRMRQNIVDRTGEVRQNIVDRTGEVRWP